MIITIDGPAGSGKSTIAKGLAKKLNFIHFNTGSLFRGITAYLYENGCDIEKIDINTKFENISLKIKFIDENLHVFINDKDYFLELRKNHISKLTPFISANRDLRNIIDDCQKKFCLKNNVVVEGRDAGSYVFPNAEYKLFLDCSVDVRAQRRFEQIKNLNTNITIEDIKKELIARDEFDKNKTIAPFKVPENAIIVDSSTLTIEETIDEILKRINA